MKWLKANHYMIFLMYSGKVFYTNFTINLKCKKILGYWITKNVYFFKELL